MSSIENGSEDRFIIDGQQRITTVSLILIALVNAYKANEIESSDKKITEKIFKRYLVDEYQEDERKVKLLLNENLLSLYKRHTPIPYSSPEEEPLPLAAETD